MNELKGKSVQVTNPIEYGVALASFIISGATVWPWHKGYKPLGDDQSHHTYVWEDCGFMKLAGVLESISGDYKSPFELMEKVKENTNVLRKENKRNAEIQDLLHDTIAEKEKVIGELMALVESAFREGYSLGYGDGNSDGQNYCGKPCRDDELQWKTSDSIEELSKHKQ